MTRHDAVRRALLSAPGAIAGSLLGGCDETECLVAPSAASAPVIALEPRRIRAVCFDLLTLFDPRSVVRRAEEVVPGRAVELCNAWRSRQFEYSWLRASAGRYVDFRAVTEEALVFAAGETKVTLSQNQRGALVDAYSELDPWPDTLESLTRFRRAGLGLAPLSNYSPAMLSKVVAHAKLDGLFTTLVSTDAARTFKPDPRAYALGPAALSLPRQSIAFAAFGGWDAAGAKWFGFPTFWLNRLGVTPEALAPGPDATGKTLAELAAFVGV